MSSKHICPMCKELKLTHPLGGDWCTDCTTALTAKIYSYVGGIIGLRLNGLDYRPVYERAKKLVDQYPVEYSPAASVALVLHIAVYVDLEEFKKLKSTIRDASAINRLSPGTSTIQLSKMKKDEE